MSKKSRSYLVATARMRDVRYWHDVYYDEFVFGPTNSIATENLDISEGHPFYKLTNHGVVPRRPKAYKGHDPKKSHSYAKNLAQYQVAMTRYRAGLGADIGGPFQVTKKLPAPADKAYSSRMDVSSSIYYQCSGNINASTAVSGFVPGPSTLSDSQLDAYGTMGIARTLPTNPLANMGQFIVELRDLPTKFNLPTWQGKAGDFRKIAKEGSSDYLNLQFGWVPFISDIISFFKVTVNSDELIEKYRKGVGKTTRKGTTLLSNTTTTVATPVTNVYPSPISNAYVSGGTLTSDVTTQRRVWFKGAYTYYLPPVDGNIIHFFQEYYAYAKKLYGLNLDLDTLYKVTPWSWGLDWVTNTGSVIRNWEAFSTGNLVLHYGYIMEEVVQTTKWSLKGWKDSSGEGPELTDLHTCISKRRRKATPYGFGLNPASFTPFQTSIITALGINRGSRWL